MQVTSDHRFQNVRDARTFALAGNALLTLHSAKTDKHFTYKVVAPDEEKQARRGYAPEPIWFVKLLTEGSADEGQFSYLGMIKDTGHGFEFILTRASKARPEAASVKAFQYFFNRDDWSQDLIVRHENHCGRCGRTLTDPVSVDTGYGPECRQLLGIDDAGLREYELEAIKAEREAGLNERYFEERGAQDEDPRERGWNGLQG